MAILLIISTGGLTYLNEMDSIIPQVEAKALPPPDLDNLLWNQTYGGTSEDRGYSVLAASDGGYIIAGSTGSFSGPFGAGESDVYLVKTNSEGNMLWSQTYGGTDDEYGRSVQVASDGGYIIAGETYSFGAGRADIYLVRIGPKVTTTTVTSTTITTSTRTTTATLAVTETVTSQAATQTITTTVTKSVTKEVTVTGDSASEGQEGNDLSSYSAIGIGIVIAGLLIAAAIYMRKSG